MLDLTRPEGSLPQDFHISRRALTNMFFAGYAVAALSAEAAPIVTPADGITIDEVLIPNGAPQPLPAYVARPKGAGRHPVIVVVNEVFGIHDYIKDICRRLAKLGFVAVAPAFFYRSGVDRVSICRRSATFRRSCPSFSRPATHRSTATCAPRPIG
jgi:carboxymethylenebutenolidase